MTAFSHRKKGMRVVAPLSQVAGELSSIDLENKEVIMLTFNLRLLVGNNQHESLDKNVSARTVLPAATSSVFSMETASEAKAAIILSTKTSRIRRHATCKKQPGLTIIGLHIEREGESSVCMYA